MGLGGGCAGIRRELLREIIALVVVVVVVVVDIEEGRHVFGALLLYIV